MAKIVKEDLPLVRHEMAKDDAIKYFADKGETYKVELIEGLEEDEPISFTARRVHRPMRRSHVPSTGRVRP